jgi:hypothetical protein
MPLTRAQRRLVHEIEEVLRLGSYDWRVVEELYEPDARLQQLKRIKQDLIRAKVIGDYVFVDELLTVIIVSYFFPVRNFPRRFKNKKMKTFMHFVMEEMYVTRKLALVKEIRDFDREMAKMIGELNSIRNAMAHGFVPEQRRDYRITGQITYSNLDISTIEGLKAYDKDMLRLHDYLFQLAFGKKLASLARQLRNDDEPEEPDAADNPLAPRAAPKTP